MAAIFSFIPNNYTYFHGTFFLYQFFIRKGNKGNKHKTGGPVLEFMRFSSNLRRVQMVFGHSLLISELHSSI